MSKTLPVKVYWTPADSSRLRWTPADSGGLRWTLVDSGGLRRTPADSTLFYAEKVQKIRLICLLKIDIVCFLKMESYHIQIL